MGVLSKSWTLTLTAGGLAALGQFPEFAQQYRQHLEGGIGELQTVVEDFDRDAASVQQDRDNALRIMERSAEEFSRKRGQSMRVAISRYENLVEQKTELDAASPVMRPLHVLQYPDPKIMEGTWRIFEPALPLTPAGLAWSGIGALFAWLLARLPVGMWRRRKERRANPANWSSANLPR
jgi:hypothetical protein